MAFQPAPGVAQVRLTFSQGGQVAQNVMHVKTEASWSLEFLDNLRNVFVEWWDVEVQPYVSDDVQFTNIEVRDLTTEFAAFVEGHPSLPLTGALDSPVLPFNSTPVITWVSGLTGRSTRGRTYHVGLSEAQAVGGSLETAAQAALNGAYSELINMVNSEDVDWNLAVLSRVQNGTPLAEALAYEIIEATMDAALDSQRRRLPGRGL